MLADPRAVLAEQRREGASQSSMRLTTLGERGTHRGELRLERLPVIRVCGFASFHVVHWRCGSEWGRCVGAYENGGAGAYGVVASSRV